MEALSREEFILVTADMPGLDKLATVHLAVSDSLGDSAILNMLTVNWLFTMILLIWS